ncbi:MAG: DUF4336 domain-containing protein [Gammaproteobacteria bacterium]|jgi:hypothetical protein|nr:DUF4336 domain-containing protein [Gammaproteobacteria bacterium]
MALESVGDSLWLAEGGLVSFYGFPYPTRSVIVRLADGDLWVWSPVRLDDALQAEVEALGPVAHLVSPNKLHYLYLRDWQQTWPDAKLWGPASTLRKCRDLDFEAPLTDEAPPAWHGQIDQFWFRGSRAMDEIVFFHSPSGTAIIGDLSENFSEEFLQKHWGWLSRRVAKLWRITEPWGYAPLELRLSWTDKAPARRALDALLAKDPRRVIMAHGEWQREDGRKYLEKAFAWLL